MIDPSMADRHTLIGSLLTVIFMVCLIFAGWIFITETLPKAYWRRQSRKRTLHMTDWRWRYGRPEIKT